MSFPYRVVAIFTGNLEAQVICLRLINVALAVAGLLIMRKLLKLLRLSDALANVVIIAFALTPMVINLSAQINYDNLLIPAVSLCVYVALSFFEKLEKNRFDTRLFLSLAALCLISSLIKVSFLPVLAAIFLLLTWKITRHPGRTKLMIAAKRDFRRIAKYQKALLGLCVIAGTLLFARLYVVDLVKYRSPAPQCDQILSVQACRHYYSWNNNYQSRRHYEAHPSVRQLNLLEYDAYWLTKNLSVPFLPVMPLQGPLYVFSPYLAIIGVAGIAALVCSLVNIRLVLRNRQLRSLAFISLVYLFFLWARNYHDYRQLGVPAAVNGRYMLPVFIFLYALLAAGARQALNNLRHAVRHAVKAGLALAVILSFLYYGGFRPYLRYITPVYGRISPADDYNMNYTLPKK
jgi:hypothetical protein